MTNPNGSKPSKNNATVQTQSNRTDAKRREFHAFQMREKHVSLAALDPDPPVELGNLQRFDGLILSLLQARGYNQTGMPSGAPRKSVRLRRMAQKIAKYDSLSDAEIEILAARIGWLQRNYFRLDARNGYDKILAFGRSKPKAAKGPTKADEPKGSTGGAAPAAPHLPVVRSAPVEHPDCHQAAPAEPSGDATLFGFEAPVSQPRAQADHNSVSPVQGSSSGQRDRFVGWPGNPTQWAEWSDRIRKAKPKGASIAPPKPKTFAKEFPVEKAARLLFLIATDKPVDMLKQAGLLLRDDRTQLHQALTHSDRARDDILDAFAHLGIDLEP